ncbi:hypothetical protein SAMN04490189_0020 [Pseudomonas koreensis]|uniref:hypothetical protein n=1 Tax=Pseudomonas koreensis TaxID=198620 RepID=UPI00087D4C72|nr:hypothetical protein [Pseudomonas koreensis]KAB0514157.1 hypothetical protein F7R05_07790 [Pseudomonas koreensis]NNA62635.1 hypothetical protein [Pseudomonas koreensis]GGK48321.1 hypothetical protein GCM10009103_48520 [Pseudomonas koreensis]SDC59495.1 hypothetical protein SAMN04490189_0020 [Pseudomonas koreensis]
MANDIWSLVLNVVASFIYAGIMSLWGMRGRRSVPQPILNRNATTIEPIELVEPDGSAGIDRRLKNREKADKTAYRFVFYLVTFGMLYLSISTPPVFKALFSSGEVYLSSARFIGEYLPAIPVGKTNLQLAFFLISALLYIPLLLVSAFLAELISPLVDSLKEVTDRIFVAITMLVSVVLCIPVAAASVWLFFDTTYTNALLSVLFFAALPFIFQQAQSGRR